ncbi:MAG: lytic transglycosylase domain-containing protein [Bdellovibrio sp.]|nr:lytic transglycosylase domain-containing protein [Bdellovibrio sp.]
MRISPSILFCLFLISCSSSQKTPAAIENAPNLGAIAPTGTQTLEASATTATSATAGTNASTTATLPADPKAAKPGDLTAVTTKTGDPKLVDFTCETLIEKSKDETFALKGLAALRAKKNCKDFTFEVKKLSDFEKRVYAEQIQEFDITTPPPTSTLSINDLKKNVKLAKTAAEKVKAFRQLRAKEKSAGLRNDFLKTTADLYNYTKAELKKNKTLPENRTNYYEAALLFARTFWTESKLNRADDVLIDALRLLKGTTSVAEIYFVTGRMAEERQEIEKAVQMYDLALEDVKTYKPKTVSFTPDRLLWIKSWILYKEKKWSEAEKSFATLSETTTDLSERSRSNFFRSRALTQLDRKEDAKALLEKITQEDFFGYYGLIAYYEMGKKLPALSKIKFEKKFLFDLNLSFLKPIERNIFMDLIRYGEIDIAEKAVGILSRNPDNQLNLGLYLAEKGERYLPLFAAFGKQDNNNRIEVMVNYGHLLYPQPYPDRVKTMSEKTAVPASLIYSIMKQESAFNEKTRSHADAMGLMQMIPRLAKQISKKFSVPYKAPEDLYKPDINIQLGSYELMEQVRKQDGQLTYVAAAYNAGGGALNGWLKNRYRANIVEFIEEIPYEETRTYVKLIARNMLFYDRVSKRDEEHAFPADFLASNESKKDVSLKN